MRRYVVIGALAIAVSALGAHAESTEPVTSSSGLQKVAEFEHEVTGVSAAPDGRIFVAFPRWTEDNEVSVAELLKDGSLKPYPDAAWNSWRNEGHDKLSPKEHWICVQSVVADGRGNLWVLDPASPAMSKVVAGGPKLVRVDLKTNQAAQSISFDDAAAPQGSYLNDVRISRDGAHAFLTDSGAKGALVVVDLQSGKVRRVLDGHPSTQAEPGVIIQTDGKPLRRVDGRGLQSGADGIALSPDDRYLYWQALTGRTIYRIATAALLDPALAPASVAAKIEKVGVGEPADGYWIDASGRLFITAIQDDAVKMWNGSYLVDAVQDSWLRWPDTMSQGPDGSIYVTASHLMDNAWFKASAKPAQRSALFKFKPTQH